MWSIPGLASPRAKGTQGGGGMSKMSMCVLASSTVIGHNSSEFPGISLSPDGCRPDSIAFCEETQECTLFKPLNLPYQADLEGFASVSPISCHQARINLTGLLLGLFLNELLSINPCTGVLMDN